jgi:hypothetical protein
MATMLPEVRTMPAVVTAHMMWAMPAMVTAHVLMAVAAVPVMAAILHLGGHALTRALHGGGNARIVERDSLRLLRRRSHEHQAGNGGKAEKFFQVHCSLQNFASIEVLAARR